MYKRMNHLFTISVATLLLFVAVLLSTDALQRSKEDIFKDANQTTTELDGLVSKYTAQGYKGLTVTLAEIRQNISQVVEQLKKETDESAITRLEMLYLRLKNSVFYEKLAIEGDIHQARLLEQRASILLEKLNATIRELESFHRTQEAEELRIDVQQLQMLNGIIHREKTTRPLRYVQLLLSAAEGKILRKLSTIDYELKKLRNASSTKVTTAKTSTTVKATTKNPK